MKKRPNQKAFYKAVRRYLSGVASTTERRAVERYYDLFSTQEDILDELDPEELRQIGLRLKSKIDSKIQNQDTQPYKLVQRIVAAASVILAVAGGLYYFQFLKLGSPHVVKFEKSVQQDVGPGSNKAILILADGSKLNLSNAQNGMLAQQQGVAINKAADGSLVYADAVSSGAAQSFNSVSTPRGGQYRLRLSDGTLVWLNAGSVLKYPVSFGADQRMVSLSGEAYFQVSKDPGHPFQVTTQQQKVRVLGTHFNISAYPEDTETKTTLLEGKVSVGNTNSSVYSILEPGEQALSSAIHIKRPIVITRIDTTEAVAWKNGYFQFRDESLESVLKKISRWYDVEIQYTGNQVPSGLYFNGTVSKYSNASQVLRKLELSGGVHFKIEGRRITVMPK